MSHEQGQRILRGVRAQVEEQLADGGTAALADPDGRPAAGPAAGAALVVTGPGPAGGRPEAVLEVLPHAREDDAYARRLHDLGERGVPLYVVVDPAEAVCTVHSHPLRTGAYREAERVPFGNDLFLPLGERTLVVSTDGFRPDPGPDPGEGHGVGSGIVDG